MPEKHPFADFVRTLARGPKLSRPLDLDEADEAMSMILQGEIEPAQLGAMFAILRYRKETPEELAGFARAARRHIRWPRRGPVVALDWPSYADRHKQLPWFVLAALLLAENGVPVLMQGIRGENGGAFTPTPLALSKFGIEPADDIEQAARQIERDNFAHLPLDRFLPALDALFGLRPFLGVRTAVNTFARLINPSGAEALIQGVFHPPYREPHVEAGKRLGQPFMAVFKGGGGEAQRNPEKPCRIDYLCKGETASETWPALYEGEKYPWREEPVGGERLAALWSGEWHHAAPEAAVTGTAALALQLTGRAETQEKAEELACEMWQARNRGKFGG